MSFRLARLLSVALFGSCLVVPAPIMAAPQAGSKAGAAAKSSLIWRGDVATAHGVMTEVSKAWEKAGHGRLELQPFNTASGIDAVASGTADLAGSARGSDGSAQNAGLTFTPVAWDAVVLITQSSNPISSLSLKQVHDIYYGRVKNWSEVGGNNAPIDVYAVASPGDGVEYSLRHLLFGRGSQPVAAPRLYVNTRKLEEGIALNPNGFGASTLAGVSGNKKLKAIPIDGKAATAANIADGSYPLFTPLYLVTSPNSPKATEVQAFIDFLQTDAAKKAMRNHAVLPYQDGSALAAMDSARRGRILAEIGAKPSNITPVSAPGATYAARAAVAPTSPDTQAARAALDQRNAATATASAAAQAKAVELASAKTQLTEVKGSVAEVSVSSLDRAKGSAVTVKPPTTSLAKVSGSAVHAVTKPAAAAPAPAAKPAAPAAGKPTAAKATGKSHVVVKGDTLYSISRTHSVKVADLRAWNNLKSDQVKLGQSLRVSSH